MTSPDYWDRLDQVTEDLAIRHRELGELLAAERDCQVRSWHESTESSVTGRDRYASLVALDLSRDIFKLRGEIKALEAEQTYLLARVAHDR